MDLGLHSSKYQLVEESYDGRGFGHVETGAPEDLELSELPKSQRAPSYVSTSRNSFFANDDEDPLIRHARVPSGIDLQGGQHSAYELLNHVQTTSTNRDRRRKRQGWHFGVAICAWTASSVLLLNTLAAIVASARFGTDDGIGTAYEGSCDVVNRMTFWLHILINALSSILLSASNYTMQALSAPTRQEVDRAHAKGDWCDIGVASVRNLSRIRWHRVVLWWMLAVSSIPIHLLYNSAIFKTIDTNQYVAVTANPSWYVDGGNFTTDIYWYNPTGSNKEEIDIQNSNYLKDLQTLFHSQYQNQSMIRNISNTECIEIYGIDFVSGYNHVVAVTNEPGNATNQTMFYASWAEGGEGIIYGWDSSDYDWLCYSDYATYLKPYCDPTSVKKNATAWTINGKRIDYCLAQMAPQHCTMQFSLHVLIAVIICNLMKSAAMLITLYRQKDVTLVTIGDALASYLDRPDEKTKGRCLMSRTDISNWRQRTRTMDGKKQSAPNTEPLPKAYSAQQSRWFSAASWKRWTVAFLLIAITILVSTILLVAGKDNLDNHGASPFGIGFGTIDARALIDVGLPQAGASGLVSSVLLANCPQAIVSFLYLLYNGLLTSMLLAKEWASYALRRKPLRVTSRHGQQRSTYYLQLPLRYSAPLLAISATLHWVISQSIFLVRLKTYSDGVEDDDDDISQVGYSCPPILVAILIGVVLVLAALALGFRKFNSSIPVASSCSVAIAAACHRPKDDLDAAYLPVQWGELRSEYNGEVGHCCFTTYEAQPPVPGRMYAGVKTSGVETSDGNLEVKQRNSKS